MGFGRRLVRKSIRKATPRTVRRAVHPVRTARYAATPKSVKKASRVLYTATNPLGAIENAAIGAVLNPGSRRRHRPSRASAPPLSRQSQWGPTPPPTRSIPTISSPSTVRANEGLTSHNRIAALMAVQRERFTPAVRPVVQAPYRPDPAAFEAAEAAARRGLAHWWQLDKRAQIRRDVRVAAAFRAEATFQHLLAQHAAAQHQADLWWAALGVGDPATVGTALNAAFADNPAPVRINALTATTAALTVLLPGPDVLPTLRAHVTPGGKLSTKKWTQTEFNDTYSALLGAHLLATARETWAVAPALSKLHISGVRWPAFTSAPSTLELLFDIDVSKTDVNWADDNAGAYVLMKARCGLNRTGRTREITPWREVAAHDV